MPTLSINLIHNIGQQSAINRVRKFADEAPIKLAPQLTGFRIIWNNNVAEFKFSYLSISISGNLLISQNDINISSNIPLVLLPLTGQIEKAVKKYALDILK